MIAPLPRRFGAAIAPVTLKGLAPNTANRINLTRINRFDEEPIG
jgi:hypothetical protein